MIYQQPAQPQPPQIPMQYAPPQRQRHSAALLVPLWIIASPVALFLAYFAIRFGYAFFHGLIFGN